MIKFLYFAIYYKGYQTNTAKYEILPSNSPEQT